ncbi:MAG: leucine-rich repeat domain-containing protein, partial [Eubacteriales bacterium]|nr:leucine-rich repeat domain-containing protein [Eubacteriales bacterium]
MKVEERRTRRVRRNRLFRAHGMMRRGTALAVASVLALGGIAGAPSVSAAAETGAEYAFRLDGNELLAAAQDILASPELPEVTDGDAKAFEALFEGEIYELVPEIEGADSDGELRVFLRPGQDQNERETLTGDEEMILLYLNHGDETASFRTIVTQHKADGSETEFKTRRVRLRSYEELYGDEAMELVSRDEAASPSDAAADMSGAEGADDTADEADASDAEGADDTADEADVNNAGDAAAGLSRHMAPLVTSSRQTLASPSDSAAYKTEEETSSADRETPGIVGLDCCTTASVYETTLRELVGRDAFEGFYSETKLDDVTVTLRAAAGVLESGTYARVEQLEEDSFTFDITLFDADGRELDPAWQENGHVSVEFSGPAIEEAKTAAAGVEVYYLQEDGEDELVDQIAFDEGEEEKVAFEASHFSVYQLRFLKALDAAAYTDGQGFTYSYEDSSKTLTISRNDEQAKMYFLTEDEESVEVYNQFNQEWSDKVEKVVLGAKIIGIADGSEELSGWYGFQRWKRLKEVVIQADTTDFYVGSHAFEENSQLSTFPFDKVGEIGENAFQQCAFKEINLTNLSGNIGAYAFSGIGDLETVTIRFTGENKTHIIGDRAFEGLDYDEKEKNNLST